MEPVALLENSPGMDERERELAERLFGDDRSPPAGAAQGPARASAPSPGEGGDGSSGGQGGGGSGSGPGGGGPNGNGGNGPGDDRNGGDDPDDETGGDAPGDDETGDFDAGFARTEEGSSFDTGGRYSRRQKIGLLLGPLLFVALLAAPTPEGLSPAGQAVGATTAWVAVWWISEAIPIPATSLLPVVLLPATGAVEPGGATQPYASTLIFLFIGGFFIAVSLQRWGLHRRIALRTIRAIGTSPTRIILGFMTATAFLSMWVSNTATVVMMTPIGLAVVLQVADLVRQQDPSVTVEQGEFDFGTGLMLCIAYAASVGGVGTLIGTPPNIVFAGVVEAQFGQEVSFFQWMTYGVPIAVVGVVLIWVYVTKFLIRPEIDRVPGGVGVIDERLEALGGMKREEKLVLAVFGLTALAWISRPYVINDFVVLGWLSEDLVVEGLLPMVDDSTIAVAGALALFLIPARDSEGEFTFLLDWTTALEIPWGVILLFGGGLSIASAFDETGLAVWIGEQLGALEGASMLAVVTVVVVLTIFMTEVTSNTATTAMLMPILASLALGLSVHPYAVMVAGATAASFAFMLPVATPPNAVVFGSGYITMPQMVRTGFGLNLLGVLLIILLSLTWLPFAWGIDVTALPPWAA